MDYSRIVTAMWQEKHRITSDGAGENGHRQSRNDNDMVSPNRTSNPISTLRFEQDKSIVPKLLNFFGLTQQPFGVTPDPSFLYLSRTHREALASLVYGIESGRGFLALIAKPGMGKTTLLFHLLDKFRDSARSAFVFQTQCNSREFLQLLFSDLGFENGNDKDFVRMIEEFNHHLLREARAGKRFIVLVDEAQNLDASVLETVRLLSNFETPSAKLLQIVLTGQPELGNKLARHDMIQLQQRLSSLNRLEPFSAAETEEYIQHRLRVSGYRQGSLLTPDALTIVTEFSKGIPRNINNFCFSALSLAFAVQQRRIDAAIAREVISDLDISLHPSEFNHAIEEGTGISHGPLHPSRPSQIAEKQATSVSQKPLNFSEPNHAPQKEAISVLNVSPSPSKPNHALEEEEIRAWRDPLPASVPSHGGGIGKGVTTALHKALGPFDPSRAPDTEVITVLNVPACPSKPNHAVEEEAINGLRAPRPASAPSDPVGKGVTADLPLDPPEPHHAAENEVAFASGKRELAPLSARTNIADDPSIGVAEAKEYMDNFIRGLRSTRS